MVFVREQRLGSPILPFWWHHVCWPFPPVFSVLSFPCQFEIKTLLNKKFLHTFGPLSGIFFLFSCYVCLVILQYLTFNYFYIIIYVHFNIFRASLRIFFFFFRIILSIFVYISHLNFRVSPSSLKQLFWYFRRIVIFTVISSLWYWILLSKNTTFQLFKPSFRPS